MFIEHRLREDIGESCTNLIEKSKGEASSGRKEIS